jgi:hypothetical protein
MRSAKCGRPIVALLCFVVERGKEEMRNSKWMDQMGGMLALPGVKLAS